MAVIILSVPHTGTRFVCTFLDRIGVVYRQHHSDSHSIDLIAEEIPAKVIIPVRDPLLCFTTTAMQDGLPLFNYTLSSTIMMYSLLKECASWFDEVEYFQLNATDRAAELARIAEFCEAPISSTAFTWEPIGITSQKPTDYSNWDILAKSLDIVEPGRSAHVLELLAEARADCGY